MDPVAGREGGEVGHSIGGYLGDEVVLWIDRCSNEDWFVRVFPDAGLVGLLEEMKYNRCGKSGLKLPQLSFGIWHGFCEKSDDAVGRSLLRTAFDEGITHFDAANVYGPPNGCAEERLGRILRSDFSGHRDEMLIATKAGYGMWDGPYGRGGSRKHMIGSIDQSLRRLQLDYVDIFYSHAPDEDAPFEETAQALADIVHSGKALYIGISNHNGKQTKRMAKALEEAGAPMLIHQVENSMLVPFKAADVLPKLPAIGAGAIVFAPLAGGRLTEKYLKGIPKDSRAATNHYLKESAITGEMIDTVGKLLKVARARGRSLPELALVWAVQHESVCSALIGATKPEQIKANCAMLSASPLDDEESEAIGKVIKGYYQKG